MASAHPTTAATMPQMRPSRRFETDSAETPADCASRNVVVTVENTTTITPTMPKPAWLSTEAMSSEPAKSAEPNPMTNIQQLPIV